MRATRLSAASALAIVLALAAVVAADLDVSIPPGLPLDWIRALPEASLTDLARVPSKRGTGSVEAARVDRVTSEGASFEFSGIATIDLPSHLPWSKPELTTAPPDVELTRSGAYELRTLAYPPETSQPLYWLALASILRTALHPAETTEASAYVHLLALGAPAYVAAQHALTVAELAPLAKRVADAVGPVPSAAPEVPVAKDPYVMMLLRLATAELVASHPYAPDRPYAAQLRMLGPEGMSPVLECSKSAHVLLRRNATTMLGQYGDEGATARLRALATDKDPVVRVRALVGLFDRRDVGALELAVAALKGKDEAVAALAADGLGRIGDEGGVVPLVAYIDKNLKEADALWSAIPALGRIGGGSAKSRAAIVKAQKAVADRPGDYLPKVDLPTTMRPDRPDPLPRTTVLTQMCTFSLAMLGDAPARELVFRLLREGGGAGAPGDKVAELERRLADLDARLAEIQRLLKAAGDAEARRRLVDEYRQVSADRNAVANQIGALDPRRRIGRGGAEVGVILRNVARANRLFVCEVLERVGTREAHELLRAVVEDKTESAQVRRAALDRLDLSQLVEFVQIPGEYRRWVDPREHGLVCASALLHLERHDAAQAVEAARVLINDYVATCGTLVQALPSQQRWPVIPALSVLGTQGAHKVGDLGRVIKAADAELASALTQDKAVRAARDPRDMYAGLRDKNYQVPPVLETAILELGGLDDPEALTLVLARIDAAGSAGRPQAVLALGGIGGPVAGARLLELLADASPWVRFAAYRAIRKLSGLDHACDWLYGTPEDHAPAIERYRDWYRSTLAGK